MTTSNRATPELIAAGKPFKANSMSGYVGDTYGVLGDLPEPWRDDYVSATRHNDVAYTVVSYSTPIAWKILTTGKWVVPDVKYSRTTSKHQSFVRQGIHA